MVWLIPSRIWRIPSREVLSSVEEKDFPDIWITFVRGYNRLTNDRGPLRILREQSKILNRMVAKRFKVAEGEMKTELASVSAELQFINEKLRAIDEKLETTPFRAFIKLRDELGDMIRKAQANITLVYNVKKRSSS